MVSVLLLEADEVPVRVSDHKLIDMDVNAAGAVCLRFQRGDKGDASGDEAVVRSVEVGVADL